MPCIIENYDIPRYQVIYQALEIVLESIDRDEYDLSDLLRLYEVAFVSRARSMHILIDSVIAINPIERGSLIYIGVGQMLTEEMFNSLSIESQTYCIQIGRISCPPGIYYRYFSTEGSGVQMLKYVHQEIQSLGNVKAEFHQMDSEQEIENSWLLALYAITQPTKSSPILILYQ